MGKKGQTSSAMAWPAEKVELVDISKLVPSARNARVHTPEQVETLAGLMLKYGVTSAALRDESGGIIAGHGRILAAELNVSRGHERFRKYPVMTAHNWTEAQKRAYMLADNQIALRAGWDEDILRSELTALGALDYELPELGFTLDDLAGLDIPGYTSEEQAERENELPEQPVIPVSASGDLWILGEHRVFCGDSTNAGHVAAALGDVKPLLMVTDPPYGVEYDPGWRGSARTGDGKRVSLGVYAKGKVQNDDRTDWREAWALFKGDVAYCWHAGRHASSVQTSLEAAGFVIRCQIVWTKNILVIGRGDYHWQHEPCWYAVRQGRTGHWAGGRKQSTVWPIPKPQKSESGHGTQKPVECMRRPMLNNSKKGDVVYDPFLGSGTSIIAAETSGRKCCGLEIDPVYVDVIVKRWEKFTGKKAVLGNSGPSGDAGDTFERVTKLRQKATPTAKTVPAKPKPAEKRPK